MWVILAGILQQNLPAGDMRKELCKDVLGIVRQSIDKEEEAKIDGVENKIVTSGSKMIN